MATSLAVASSSWRCRLFNWVSWEFRVFCRVFNWVSWDFRVFNWVSWVFDWVSCFSAMLIRSVL